MGVDIPPGWSARLVEIRHDPRAWVRHHQGEKATTEPVTRRRYVVEPVKAACVDVDELLRILDPTPTAQPVMADTGRYPLPEVGCELIRIASGETRTSTGHELAVSLAGATLYLPRGATLTATATTFIATAHLGRAMSQPPT